MKAAPVVLGLDQATKMGWAIGTAETAFACGLIDTTPRRFDSYGSRYLRVEKEVTRLLVEHKPTLVVFEEHRRHNSTQAAQVLGAITAIVAKCCEQEHVDYFGIPVLTLKKHFTGSATASKALMLAVARKKFPHLLIPDDNVADALSMYHYGVTKILKYA